MKLSERLGAVARAAAGQVPDALMVAGGSGIAYGAWLVYQPAGFIVGGVIAFAAGWLLSRSAA